MSLLNDIKNNNRRAFKEFFFEYYPIFLLYARHYLSNDPLCQDITQEAIVNFWKKRNDFEHISQVKRFIFLAIRNSCLNHIRDSRRVEPIDSQEFFELSRDGHLTQIELETYQLVRKAVNMLPMQMKKVVELTLDGYRNSEIAEQLHIAEGTVHATKKQAYKKLKIELKDKFYGIFIL